MIDDVEVKKIAQEVRQDFQRFEEDKDLRNLLTVLLYDEGKTRDTLDLFEILPMEYFVKVVKLLNGRRVRFLDFEQLQVLFKTAILYLEIDQEKHTWKEVMDKYPEWRISINQDKILIDKMTRSLQEKALSIFEKE